MRKYVPYAAVLIFALFQSIKATSQTEIKPEWLVSASMYHNGGFMKIQDMAEDSKGSVVAVGYFESTIDFDPSEDTFELSASGDADIFIAKYSKEGKMEYAYSFGGKENASFEAAYSIAIDKQDNAYIVGAFGNTIDFDPGTGVYNLSAPNSTEIFVLSLSAAGIFRYAINIADSKNEQVFQLGRSITVDSQKNIFITGAFIGEDIDFDPGEKKALFSSGAYQDIFFAKYDSVGNYVFAKALKGYGFDESEKILLDHAGNIVICGVFLSSKLDCDPDTASEAYIYSNGRRDIFFAKYDATGKYIFGKGMGGVENDNAYSFAIEKDNSIILTGSFESNKMDFDPGSGSHLLFNKGLSDFFFARYDINGNYIYAYSIGGIIYDVCTDVDLDESGNIIVTGYFSGDAVDFDPGPGVYTIDNTSSGYIYFAKYKQDGTFISANAIGSWGDFSNNSNVTCLLASKNGGFAIGGYFQDTLDVEPGQGIVNIYEPANTLFIAKYSDDGNYISSITADNYFYYTNATTYVNASTIDSMGNVYIAGYFNGRFDFDPGPGTYILESLADYNSSTYFAKYNKNGELIFAKALISGSSISSMVVDKEQNIYFTGLAYGTTDFDPSEKVKYINNRDTPDYRIGNGFYYAKYSKDGSLIFANGNNKNNSSSFNAIAVDSKQNIYLTGGFSSKQDFDCGPGNYSLYSKGGMDIFIVKYNPNGNFLSAIDIGQQNSSAEAEAIKINASDEIIIAGEFDGSRTDFDPGPKKFFLNSGSGQACFVAGYKSNLGLHFANAMGALKGIADIRLNSLSVDKSNNIFIGGFTNGNYDFNPGADTFLLDNTRTLFFASYVSDGKFRFAKGLYSKNNTYSYYNSIKQFAHDSENNLYLCGDFDTPDIDCDPGDDSAILINEYYAPYNFDISDLFIAKYDSLGNYIASYDIDGDSAVGSNFSTGIYTDKAGDIIFTGYGVTKLDFDPGPDTNYMHITSPHYNLFISKYSQAENCLNDENLFSHNDGAGIKKVFYQYSNKQKR